MLKSWPEPIILTYHEVLPDGASLSRYSVSCKQLVAHLQFARRCTTAPRIVFDDGDRSNFDHALPLLDDQQASATFFVTAGFVGHHPQTMTWSELRELTQRGHSVQAHGWSHRFLTQCSDSELRRELGDAKNCLEHELGCPVTEVSFPGGRFDDRVLAFAAEAGYEGAYTSQPWSRASADSPLRLRGRVMLRRSMDVPDLQKLIDQDFPTRFKMYAEHCLRTGIRKLVSESRYDHIWRRLARREEAFTHMQASAAAFSVSQPSVDADLEARTP